jgi:hypothetical protein
MTPQQPGIDFVRDMVYAKKPVPQPLSGFELKHIHGRQGKTFFIKKFAKKAVICHQ